MMAIGHFSVTKDHWNDKEVSYYTDPEYGKYARNIFGETPSMIDYFSDILGTPYPWEKFAQVVVHDYVSGAMENTTAVVHGTNMQQDPREMLDVDYTDYIAHELFHHWFGDLVTCESWSNITLNEGFADYSEYLWREHRYGKELADQEFKKSMSSYISYSKQDDAPLIRYFYSDKEDVYDAISYNKGGCVLHMLRQEVGDEAFFAALKDYLSVNAFRAAEINDLRKSFEKITGRDLNWFFDQWFINGGHPVLNISYQWNDTALTQTVTIEQIQDTKIYPVYRLPLKIDVYLKDSIDHRNVVCDSKISTFSFSYSSKPLLVNVDASKSLLCSKKDQHTKEEWCFQYDHAPLYADRHEALTALSKKYSFGTNEARVVRKALTDPAPRIREIAAENIGTWTKKDSSATLALLADRLSNDTIADVRLAALKAINKNYEYESFSNLLWSAAHDKSYQVTAEAFEIISNNDSATASKLAEELKQDSGSAIIAALAVYYAKQIHEDHYDFFDRAIRRTSFWDRAAVIKAFGNYLITQPYDNQHKGISRLIVYTQQTSGRFSRSAGIAALRNIKKFLEDSAEGNKLLNEPQEELNQYEIEIERINTVLEEFDKKNTESEIFEH
jgi:aminopeptidase N